MTLTSKPTDSETGERDLTPTVTRPLTGPSGAVIGLAVIAAGAIMFSVLDARRRSLSAPAVAFPKTAETAQSPVPPLYIPAEATPVEYTLPQALMTPPAPPAPSPAPRQPPPAAISYQPSTLQQQSYPPPLVQRPVRSGGGSSLVLDLSQPKENADRTPGSTADNATTEGAGGTGRARASTIANRATTVPQGTIITAVLETALDSSHPGFARALVQRDVRGFDGTKILIPRGSRLIGEYQADASAGQKRAFIGWSRLIRPDGGTIALGSPTTDTVGKGGIAAKVDSHFFERFSGAILQSALDVGVNLAARAADRSVVVALPGSIQGQTQVTTPTQIPPTLSVKQGTSISVFAARDLDFTDIEQRQ